MCRPPARCCPHRGATISSQMRAVPSSAAAGCQGFAFCAAYRAWPTSRLTSGGKDCKSLCDDPQRTEPRQLLTIIQIHLSVFSETHFAVELINTRLERPKLPIDAVLSEVWGEEPGTTLRSNAGRGIRSQRFWCILYLPGCFTQAGATPAPVGAWRRACGARILKIIDF